jgi:hypothetical protein
VLPWPAHGRTGTVPPCRNERDRQRGVPESRRTVPLDAIDRLFDRAGRAANLGGRRVGQQLRVLCRLVVAVPEHVGANRPRDEPCAEQEESKNEQRRHDADEDVGQDQFSADAPEQPPLHQKHEARHEEQNGKRQPDRCGGVDDLEEARQIASKTNQPDDDLECGRDDEEAARPRVQEEIPRGSAGIVYRQWQARLPLPAPGRRGRVHESPAGHAN